ncbi:MAG: TetR/AcrR family transcriptional regulator [Desulfobacterales bacterium]
MNYAEFQNIIKVSKLELYHRTFSDNKESIRIKNEKTALKNLEKIFCATLKISNRKGYHNMSMRDLSRETGLSMGALYAYFSSKEELLGMLQRQVRTLVRQVLEKRIESVKGAAHMLRMAVKTHLYLSEIMQPWFYFSYMESKNLSDEERKNAIESELATETMIRNILERGEAEGVFLSRNHQLSAGLVKAMLQEWYINRWKYAKKNVSVDQYADFVLQFIEVFYRTPA